MEAERQILQTIEALSETMRQSMRKVREEAGDSELLNVTITQLHYLHAIEQLNGPTFSQLVEKFNVQKPTVTEIVNRLIKRRLVYKKQSQDDLRSYHLYLDAQGQRLLELERQGYRQFARKMTANLTDHEKSLLTAVLKKIENGLDE